MLGDVVRRLGNCFTPEEYLFWTRVQGTLWTTADIIIVYYCLRLANLCRALLGHRLHRLSYAVLAGTVSLALLLPFAPNGLAFFRLELGVTVPHFALILYVVWADARLGAVALNKLIFQLRNRKVAHPLMPI